MVTKKIQLVFLLVTFIALIVLAKNMYSSYDFKNNPISGEYQEAIMQEERRVLSNMQKNFGFSYKVPIIVTDKIPGKIYGLTSQEDSGNVKIYLNKKVMKESFNYIISDVIAHEYAHALLFKSGYYQNGGKGHSEIWRETCVKLGGRDCRQYVNSHEVVMGKLPF